VQAYAILGGVPRYLEEFDPKAGIEENIKNKILNKTSFLYNEPLNLLFEEFRSPASYVSILLAIPQG
jgi:AAA+ ATPase superfamily predicted ATPase